MRIFINLQTSKSCVQNHPDYPSILAIGSCLSDWGIDNHTYRIDKENYQDGLLFPFVAHFPEKGGRFIVVTAINGTQIFYSDELITEGVLSEEEFLKRWDGIALHAEPNKESGEVDYTQNRIKELLRWLMAPTAILALAMVFWIAFASQSFNWSILILSMLKLSGIGVSILLLMQSLNTNNPFIKNLCTLNGKNDCNAILKSEAAKVTNWLTWSEVGFFYFAGSFLALLFDPTSLPLLAWLNLFALPYTIYSITYQYRNKNWCVLCCSVQVLLVLEAVTFFSNQRYELLNFPSYGLLALVCFLIPILGWSFLKPFFSDASQIKSLKSQLKKFKYNSELFNQALKNQPRYAVPDELMPIVLGNPNAETTITVVSNPFCGPCAKAHEILDALLKLNDKIKIKIIMPASKLETDPRKQMAKHLHSLNYVKGTKFVENALNDWFTQTEKNYKRWAEKYPVALFNDMDKIIEDQDYWCDLVEIKVTPTIFVNGHKLPDPYKLEDMQYLLN